MSDVPQDLSQAAGEASADRGPVLSPDIAARARALSFRAERAVEGLLSGVHRSPHRGASVVFVEHREYRPGDEPRLLDWRAYARADRHVIKRFEQETQLRAMLLRDESGSMAFAGCASDTRRDDARRKDDHAAELLAALALVLIRQGDAVGFHGLTPDRAPDAALDVAPRSRPAHLDVLFARLAQRAEGGRSLDLADALGACVERAGRRGLVVLASDLLDRRPETLAPLRQLHARGHVVFVLHVLHRDELELPVDGPARFVGLEGEPSVDADPDVVRGRYQDEMAEFLDECERRCVSAGARYLLAPTDVPVERTLSELLVSRRRRR